MQQYYVDSPELLLDLCDRLRGSAFLVIDTEFMREKTFFSKLCLLQIASENVIACVDPILITDLSPLVDIIYDPGILKIMHAGRQDLEIFYDLYGRVPKPLFDTQIAATLLGFGDQVSYATLVRDMVGVNLEKTYTRTNWSQRPLDPGQIKYAEDDVRYLVPIYQRQMSQLENKQCVHWLDEDFAELTEIKNYEKPSQIAWRRIRGIRILRGIQLAVLKELATWREERAKLKNKPRKWILRDDVLVDLARHSPTTINGLYKIRGLESNVIKRVGESIIEVIANAVNMQPDAWPKLGFRFVPNSDQEALVDTMVAIVRQCGIKHGISPGALATRRDLEQLLVDRTSNALMRGWRKQLLGGELNAFLSGERYLFVADGQLKIQEIKN